MGLHDTYRYIVDELVDQRTNRHFFMASPWPIIITLALYVYIVKVLGPKFMKNRQPYNVDWLIHIYNIIQVAWNFWMFLYSIRFALVLTSMNHPSWWCLPSVPTDSNPYTKVAFEAAWHYYHNKIFDLSDTLFFILRKKFNQISYVHIYHHISMCGFGYLFLKFGASAGNGASIGILNTFIHVVMYTYYELALMGKHEWLWWKKYLTQMQIVQFVIALIHNVSVFFQSSCDYNPYFATFATLQALYFIYLFSNFYIQSYKKENKKKN